MELNRPDKHGRGSSAPATQLWKKLGVHLAAPGDRLGPVAAVDAFALCNELCATTHPPEARAWRR